MKHSTNPIYSFLRWSDYLTDEEKLEILKEIEKSYNLAKTIKDDLKKKLEKKGNLAKLVFEKTWEYYLITQNQNRRHFSKNVSENRSKLTSQSRGDLKKIKNSAGWQKRYKKDIKLKKFKLKIIKI